MHYQISRSQTKNKQHTQSKIEMFPYQPKTTNKRRQPNMLILKVIAQMHQNRQKTRKRIVINWNICLRQKI